MLTDARQSARIMPSSACSTPLEPTSASLPSAAWELNGTVSSDTTSGTRSGRSAARCTARLDASPFASTASIGPSSSTSTRRSSTSVAMSYGGCRLTRVPRAS